MAGLHHHKCKCGNVWEHEQEREHVTEEQYDAAHTCSQCGAEVRKAHFKSHKAQVEFCEIMAAEGHPGAVVWLLLHNLDKHGSHLT